MIKWKYEAFSKKENQPDSSSQSINTRIFRVKTMGCRIFKRLLLFVLLLFVVRRTVDFSATEFDPLRHHIDASLDKITSNQYYHEYISPLNEKYQPFICDLQSRYAAPAYKCASSFFIGNYQTYLSKHVDTIVSYITNNAVYGKATVFIPVAGKYYRLSHAHFKSATQQSLQYLAIGLTHIEKYAQICYTYVQKYAHIAYVQIIHFYKLSSVFATKQWTTLRPLVIDFYHSKALPATKTLKNASIRGACSTYRFLASVYKSYVDPLVQSQIVSRASPLYNSYVSKYVQIVKFQVTKLYKLLRVHQALSLSKTLLTNSYDTVLSYYQGESETASAVNSTAATIEKATELTETETVNIEETKTAIVHTEEVEGRAQPIEEDPELPLESESSDSLEIKSKTEAEEEENDNEVNISLFEEITSWRTFIHETVDNIFKNFDTSINKLESEALAELTPKVKAGLRELTERLTKDYSEVNKQIYNIESKEAILENGEVVNLDKDGKILDKKITREDFRAYLNEAKEVAPARSDEIWEVIKEKIKGLEADIDDERKIIVDIYEEFAEVAINEFSKKMMYSTFSNSFNKVQQVLENGEENTENFEDWKEYIKVKKFLVNERETLINKSHDLTAFKSYLNDIQVTLQTLVAEAGNFYAMARARANIEFQTREAAERELQKKLDAEEDYTITSSVLKFVTLTQGEDGEIEATGSVEIETPEEEEISDDEGETYETPYEAEEPIEDKSIEDVVPEDTPQATPDASPKEPQEIVEEATEVVEESTEEVDDEEEVEEDFEVEVEEDTEEEDEEEDEEDFEESSEPKIYEHQPDEPVDAQD